MIPEASRRPGPDFTLNEAAGQAVTLAGLKGKVVLLNFWATWCHGCKTEIPCFIEFQQTDRNRGLVVLGVFLDDDRLEVGPVIHEPKQS